MTTKNQLLGIPIQRICVTTVIGTQVNVDTIARPDLNLSKIGARHRLLQEVHLAHAVTYFGREVAAPV